MENSDELSEFEARLIDLLAGAITEGIDAERYGPARLYIDCLERAGRTQTAERARRVQLSVLMLRGDMAICREEWAVARAHALEGQGITAPEEWLHYEFISAEVHALTLAGAFTEAARVIRDGVRRAVAHDQPVTVLRDLLHMTFRIPEEAQRGLEDLREPAQTLRAACRAALADAAGAGHADVDASAEAAGLHDKAAESGELDIAALITLALADAERVAPRRGIGVEDDADG
ncbi:MAG: hypothetical protein H6816_09665 [Phycisphaerales bacterium]|nr:hypothetical protein [Phycisphaerales bacterium]